MGDAMRIRARAIDVVVARAVARGAHARCARWMGKNIISARGARERGFVARRVTKASMMCAPWRIADVGGLRSRVGDRDTDRARATTTRPRRRSRGGRFITNRPSSIVLARAFVRQPFLSS